MRKRNNREDVYIDISRGQFLHSEGLTIRFDDDPALHLSAGEPADNSTDTAFLEFPANCVAGCRVELGEFVSRLKVAKRLRIQATFYDQGQRVFEFKSAGLQWAE